MKMADPKPTFSYIVSELAQRHPDFAYIHLVEPRVEGNVDRTVIDGEVSETVARQKQLLTKC